MTGSRNVSLGNLFVEISFIFRGPAYLHRGSDPPRVLQPPLVCSRSNPPGPGSRGTASVSPAPIPPLGTAAGRASSPQERGRSRVHGPSLTPGPRSIRTEETSSRLGRCAAGSRPPGASLLTADTFRLTSAHKGPGPQIAGPASAASPTERPPQQGSLPPRVRPSTAVPAAILNFSSQPRLVLLRLKYAVGGSRGDLWGPGADGHPQGSASSVNSGSFVGRMTEGSRALLECDRHLDARSHALVVPSYCVVLVGFHINRSPAPLWCSTGAGNRLCQLSGGNQHSCT
ncbi:hypothetical protein NDU88_004468 [Pleurodeles waltl]|uniref:Uncharacterized protein n=1 Tax=Pleurodeles waltl TaxID=8319 RepID=A0AAV7SJ27_PLEWA|nr:hypothetical protein NDU88_004468 [Pleurodeles waltl]